MCQATGNVLTKWGGGEITALAISVVRLAFGIVGLTIILGATRRLLETWTLMSTNPVLVLPLAYVFEDEELTLRSILGAVVAVAGVAVLNLT